MKAMIRGYRNIPGEHCGSTAMRNLLFHYCGLELSEEEVFGIGSGLDFLLIRNEANDPAVYTFGRSVTMEIDIADALGFDYREEPEPDNARAWEVVRHEVDEGRPTMLSGDAFYLDYRDFRVHFPSHRYVLLGYDDERRRALVADRIAPDLQECSYEALALSRNPPLAISTRNLWGKFHGTSIGRSVAEAMAHALEKSARRMVGTDTSQTDLLRMLNRAASTEITSGLAALRSWYEALPAWRTRSDARGLATYSSNTIEKYGTGGANFRVLYAGFLRHARAIVPELVTEQMVELMDRSTASWTRLGTSLATIAAGSANEEWRSAHTALGEIVSTETELFERLGERTAVVD
jgi:hypothetical protein